MYSSCIHIHGLASNVIGSDAVTRQAVGLVDISEIHVFAIGQVGKGCGVEVTAFQPARLLRLDLVAAAVFGAHQNPEGEDDDDLEEMTTRRSKR